MEPGSKEMADYLEFVKNQKELVEQFYKQMTKNISEFHDNTCPNTDKACKEKFISITVLVATDDRIYDQMLKRYEMKVRSQNANRN